VLENAPDAISIIDQDLNITRVNGEFTRCSALPRRRLPGNALTSSSSRSTVMRKRRGYRKPSGRKTNSRWRRDDGGKTASWSRCCSPLHRDRERQESWSIRLVSRHHRQKRAEDLNAALYAIAARRQSAEDLQQFFAAIHNIVGQLMNARNFYIALYDPATQLLSFPYFVDEQDPPPAPKSLGRGLTEYVMRSGEPLLATPAVFEELVKRGEVELIGAPSLDWLGVPLKSGASCIGALVVQCYNENARFAERDREILKFVSQQLAAAIEHKRYEEALRRSEARSRSLILSAVFGICRCTVSGKFLDVNPALIAMLGHGSVEDMLQLDAGANLRQTSGVGPAGRRIPAQRNSEWRGSAMAAQGRPHHHRAAKRLRRQGQR